MADPRSSSPEVPAPAEGVAAAVDERGTTRAASTDLGRRLKNGEFDTASFVELIEDPPSAHVGPRFQTMPSLEEDEEEEVRIPRHRSLHVEVVEAGPISRRPIARLSDITELQTDGADEDELVATSVRALVEVREALSQRERELASLGDELLRRERELEIAHSRRWSPRSRRPRYDPDGDVPSSVDKTRVLFLSESIGHALADGWRTADDFVAELNPAYVMGELDRHPAVRALYLTHLVGLPERTALRTPAADAGRLLAVALEEGDCPASEYARSFHRTATAGYVALSRLWRFAAGPGLLEAAGSRRHERHDAAKQQIVRLVDRAIAHGLFSPARLIEGITVETLAERLPRATLGALVRAALDAGRAGSRFTDVDAVTAVPMSVIVEHVPPALAIEHILEPMALAAGFLEPPPT